MSSGIQNDPIVRWAESISGLLAAYQKLTSDLSRHGTTVGNAREFFVSEVLRRFLPQSLHVGTGQLLGDNGQLSRQIDILIYRTDCPILSSLAIPNVYFAAGVVATIEVKSNLAGGEKGTLHSALTNSLSVKQTEFGYSSKDESKNNFDDLRHIQPSTCIFGFSGFRNGLTALKEALAQWVNQNATSILQLPDVVVAEGCVVVKNDYRFFDSNRFRQELGYNPIFLAARDDTPLQWLLNHLLNHVTGCLGPVMHRRTNIRLILPKDYLGRRALEQKAEFWGKWDFENDKGRILEFR